MKRQRPTPTTGNQKKKIKTSENGEIGQQFLGETTYLLQNGLRTVVPYVYIFQVFAKDRWQKRTLLDVLLKEFEANDQEYYEKAIETGRIKVNHGQTKPDYLVKEHDIISHMVHRHEPPVSADPIKIIHEDDNILVINKPGSLPVHPSGRFRHNTVVFILSKEFGQKKLHCIHNLTTQLSCFQFLNYQAIHRIDRLTSGILLLAKNPDVAKNIAAQIQDGATKKYYLAMVHGSFPEGVIDINEPIGDSETRGKHVVSPDGKPAHTRVFRLGYDPTKNCSLVVCHLLTGRTHQIRVHLFCKGFPIIQDPLYNNDPIDKHQLYFSEVNQVRRGPVLPEETNPHTPIALENQDKKHLKQSSTVPKEEILPKAGAEAPTLSHQLLDEPTSENTQEQDESHTSLIQSCLDCRLESVSGDQFDPNPEDLFLYLHAYSYSSTPSPVAPKKGTKQEPWFYITEIPSWAVDFPVDVGVPKKSQDFEELFNTPITK